LSNISSWQGKTALARCSHNGPQHENNADADFLNWKRFLYFQLGNHIRHGGPVLLLGGIVRAATDLLLLLGLLALLIDTLGDHLVVHLGLGLRLLDAGADGRLPLALALASQREREKEQKAWR
jgi:hypothetical protein